jgi:hypothetical protein
MPEPSDDLGKLGPRDDHGAERIAAPAVAVDERQRRLGEPRRLRRVITSGVLSLRLLDLRAGEQPAPHLGLGHFEVDDGLDRDRTRVPRAVQREASGQTRSNPGRSASRPSWLSPAPDSSPWRAGRDRRRQIESSERSTATRDVARPSLRALVDRLKRRVERRRAGWRASKRERTRSPLTASAAGLQWPVVGGASWVRVRVASISPKSRRRCRRTPRPSAG